MNAMAYDETVIIAYCYTFLTLNGYFWVQMRGKSPLNGEIS